MKVLRIILFFIGIVGISRVGLGQERDEVGLPGYEHGDPAKEVKLFPNPAIEYVSVKLETPHARHVKVTVHSIIGNTMEVESEAIDDHEIRIKVKDLPSGYYLLALKDEASGLRGIYKFLKR